jgi:hypothetical protein
LGRRLRGGHDHDPGVGEEPAQAQGDVTGSGRHVDHQHLGLVPEHVGDELLQHLVEHGAAPDDRGALLGEQSHRHHPHAVGDQRDEQPVHDDRAATDAHHARDREAPHVGVHQRHAATPPGHGDGDVGGHGRLADAPLAGGDGEDPGLGEHGRRVGLLPLEMAAQPGPVTVVHGRQVDDDLVDAQRADRRRHLVPDALALGVAGDGQGQRHVYTAGPDHHALDHAAFAERAAQLWLDHGPDRSQHLGLGRHGGRLGRDEILPLRLRGLAGATWCRVTAARLLFVD